MTAVAATMIWPDVAPFRWVGFNCEVRTIVLPDRVLFLASDVCQALEIEVPFESEPGRWGERIMYRYPGRTMLVNTTGGYATGTVDDVYTHDELVRVANDHPAWHTAIFLHWIDEVVDGALASPEAFIDPEPAVKDIAAGLTYSVARAARILSRDPVLDYGQVSLFEAMQSFGWIARDHEIWIPASDQLAAGLLVRHRVRIGGHHKKVTYPQIRITRAGLEQLHQRLGGVATLTIDEAPALTLVDL